MALRAGFAALHYPAQQYERGQSRKPARCHPDIVVSAMEARCKALLRCRQHGCLDRSEILEKFENEPFESFYRITNREETLSRVTKATDISLVNALYDLALLREFVKENEFGSHE